MFWSRNGDACFHTAKTLIAERAEINVMRFSRTRFEEKNADKAEVT
jgi:hypothetical protein